MRIAGADYRVPLWFSEPEAGDRVTVRYHPATGRAELIDDVFDPAPTLGLGAFAFAVGCSLWFTHRARSRQMRRLLTEGGPAFTAATAVTKVGVLLGPTDNAHRPFLLLRSPVPAGHAWGGIINDGAGDLPVGLERSGVQDDPPPPPTPHATAGSKPDLHHERVAQPAGEPPSAHVIGLSAEGAPVLVRISPTHWSAFRRSTLPSSRSSPRRRR